MGRGAAFEFNPSFAPLRPTKASACLWKRDHDYHWTGVVQQGRYRFAMTGERYVPNKISDCSVWHVDWRTWLKLDRHKDDWVSLDADFAALGSAQVNLEVYRYRIVSNMPQHWLMYPPPSAWEGRS